MTDQGFGVVRPLPGNGLVAHVGGLLLVCDAAEAVVSELLGAVRETAASGGDGRALARRAAQVLARAMAAAAEPASCAVAGPAAGGVAVLVSGEASATVLAASGEVALAGHDSLTWTDRLVPGPVERVELRLPGAGEAHPQVRLDDGVVVGGGAACDYTEAGAARPGAMSAGQDQMARDNMHDHMHDHVHDHMHDHMGQDHMHDHAGREHEAPAQPPMPVTGASAAMPDPQPVRDSMHGAEPERQPMMQAPPPAPVQQPQPQRQPPYPLGGAGDPMGPGPAPQPPVPMPQPPVPMPPPPQQPPAGGPAYGPPPSEPFHMPPPQAPAEPARAMAHEEGEHAGANGAPGEGNERPFESVLLLPDGGGSEPEPEAPAEHSEPESRPLVYGVDCKNDHFNDPRVPYCAVCGIALVQRTLVPYKGPRPPLGVLLLDDGMTLRLDTDYLLGRDPERAAEVSSGAARPAKVTSPDGSVSRRHLRVALDGWDVNLIDLGSVNGTQIQPPGDPNFYDIPPNEPVAIAPGTTVRIGVSRTMRYESHRNR